MKRLLIIVVFLFFLTLSGCAKESDKSSKFRLAMMNYDYKQTTGYYFKSTQMIEGQKGNERIITQKIDWENQKAYTEIYERTVDNFNVNSKFTESSQTTYYHQNQIGLQTEDESVTWQTGTLEAYINNKLPIRTVYDSILEPGYLIKETESGHTLIGTIKDPSQIITNADNIKRLDIEIGITFEGLLAFIQIEIVYPNSILLIDYQVYYEKQTVIIP